jgi:hypothetical protein
METTVLCGYDQLGMETTVLCGCDQLGIKTVIFYWFC